MAALRIIPVALLVAILAPPNKHRHRPRTTRKSTRKSTIATPAASRNSPSESVPRKPSAVRPLPATKPPLPLSACASPTLLVHGTSPKGSSATSTTIVKPGRTPALGIPGPPRMRRNALSPTASISSQPAFANSRNSSSPPNGRRPRPRQLDPSGQTPHAHVAAQVSAYRGSARFLLPVPVASSVRTWSRRVVPDYARSHLHR